MNLFEVAKEIADRLTRIFLRNEDGKRPVYGGTEKFKSDPYWRDHILFYEYFHGDNGAGLGASHQTGWTGLVARLIQLFGLFDAKRALEGGIPSAFVRTTPTNVAAEIPGPGRTPQSPAKKPRLGVKVLPWTKKIGMLSFKRRILYEGP